MHLLWSGMAASSRSGLLCVCTSAEEADQRLRLVVQQFASVGTMHQACVSGPGRRNSVLPNTTLAAPCFGCQLVAARMTTACESTMLPKSHLITDAFTANKLHKVREKLHLAYNDRFHRSVQHCIRIQILGNTENFL